MFNAVAQTATEPVVSTDKTSYAQGESIQYTGQGFTPNGATSACLTTNDAIISALCVAESNADVSGYVSGTMLVGSNIPIGQQAFYVEDVASGLNSNKLEVTILAEMTNDMMNGSVPVQTTRSWAGFISFATSLAPISSISSTFTVPYIACVSPQDNSLVIWVGIDGGGEQAGVTAQCANGVPTYWVWYELLPQTAVVLRSLQVAAGETIAIAITYQNNTFTFLVQNLNTNQTVTIPYVPTQMPSLLDAECVIERVFLAANMPLPLANFGSITFHSCNVQPSQSLYIVQQTMVNDQGQTLAQVVQGTPSDFIIAWQQAK